MKNLADSQQEELLIFMHIPKTAGTTLREIVCQQYEEKAIYKSYVGIGANSLKEHIEKIKKHLDAGEKIKIIVGHMGFGLHKLLNYPSSYITILRNPVERVVSLYNHIRRDPNNHLHLDFQKMSLKDVISSGICEQIDNHQTRLLARSILSNNERERTDLNAVPYGKCSIELLEGAKKNLKTNFRVVGITEKFDDMLIVCGEKLGWKDFTYKPSNVSQYKESELDQDTLKCIENKNELDIELYNFAKKILEEDIKKVPQFKEKLSLFKEFNK